MSYICLSRGEDTEKSRHLAAFFIAKREKKVRCFLKRSELFQKRSVLVKKRSVPVRFPFNPAVKLSGHTLKYVHKNFFKKTVPTISPERNRSTITPAYPPVGEGMPMPGIRKQVRHPPNGYRTCCCMTAWGRDTFIYSLSVPWLMTTRFLSLSEKGCSVSPLIFPLKREASMPYLSVRIFTTASIRSFERR